MWRTNLELGHVVDVEYWESPRWYTICGYIWRWNVANWTIGDDVQQEVGCWDLVIYLEYKCNADCISGYPLIYELNPPFIYPIRDSSCKCGIPHSYMDKSTSNYKICYLSINRRNPWLVGRPRIHSSWSWDRCVPKDEKSWHRFCGRGFRLWVSISNSGSWNNIQSENMNSYAKFSPDLYVLIRP